MKSRVEARDGWDSGHRLGHRVERRQRLRLMRGGHLNQLAQAFLDAGIDQHRLPEPFPAMDDPMSNGVSVSEPLTERVAQLAGVERRAGSGELALDQRHVAVTDQAQLDAARTRVDNEDAPSDVRDWIWPSGPPAYVR